MIPRHQGRHASGDHQQMGMRGVSRPQMDQGQQGNHHEHGKEGGHAGHGPGAMTPEQRMEMGKLTLGPKDDTPRPECRALTSR